MCGIVGYSSPTARPDIGAAVASIGHRGPDGIGTYLSDDGVTGLGHARLSIVDLSAAGAQPMTSDDGRFVIIYNGELYNLEHLRGRIDCTNKPFRGHSDTEVLLRLLEDQGLECLKELNGIFSFALFDSRERTLTLVRDNFGVKPLYYSAGSSRFLFSSEIKGLVAMGADLGSADPISLARYSTYLWCPGNGTPVTGVRKLGPGEAMTIRDGEVLRHWRWFRQPALKPQRANSGVREAVSQTTDRLRTAVRRQMVADVPVGAFLSGGLDSSAVVAFAREVNADIQCFTIDTGQASDGATNDLPYARQVARHLDVPLDVVRVEPGRMAEDLVRMVVQLDEPLADPAALHVFYISQLARSQGIKVLLSGTGGDDLFTGYRRHRAVQADRLIGLIPQRVRSAAAAAASRLDHRNPNLRRLNKLLSGSDLHGDRKVANYLSWIGANSLYGLYTEDFRTSLGSETVDKVMTDFLSEMPDGSSDLERLLALEQRYFLADHNLIYTDKMSMAAGVEVRVPFLDLDLVEYASTLPDRFKQRGSTGKWILKKSMESYLPADVIYRPKTGFGAPLRSWLKNELRNELLDLLSPTSLSARNIFDAEAARKLIEDNDAGRVDGTYTLFSMMCIEIWFRHFVDGSSEGRPPRHAPSPLGAFAA